VPHHLEPQFGTATVGSQAEKAACDGLREANRPLRTVNQDCMYVLSTVSPFARMRHHTAAGSLRSAREANE
jgi:hypothetical protein